MPLALAELVAVPLTANELMAAEGLLAGHNVVATRPPVAGVVRRGAPAKPPPNPVLYGTRLISASCATTPHPTPSPIAV